MTKQKAMKVTVFNVKTDEFTNLTDDERTALKWKFLLERCKIYVKVSGSSVSRSE